MPEAGTPSVVYPAEGVPLFAGNGGVALAFVHTSMVGALRLEEPLAMGDHRPRGPVVANPARSGLRPPGMKVIGAALSVT